jgi:hypothetical protein
VGGTCDLHRFTNSRLAITDQIDLDERSPAEARNANGGARRQAETVLPKMTCVDRVESSEIAVELSEVNAHEYGILVAVSGMSQDAREVLEAEERLRFDALGKRGGGCIRVRRQLSGDVKPARCLHRMRIQGGRRRRARVGDDVVDFICGHESGK